MANHKDLKTARFSGPWNIAAAVLWSAILAVLLIRSGLHPARPTSLTTYLTGGSAWIASEPLYTNWRGFVYPPAIAWFFSLFARMPLGVAAVLWRCITAGTFLFGLGTLLRSEVFHRIQPAARGLVFIGVLPLAIGNIDNAQANPLVAGLMMLSVAAMQSEAWTLCAVAGGLATEFKIYPIALALLLCVLRPRKLCWRLGLVMVLLALLPFAFQSAGYVSGQYGAWFHSRLNDDRFTYPMKDAPLDLWYLLVRLGHLPVSEHIYTAFQAATGLALAVFARRQTRRRAPFCESLASIFLLVSAWMLLLGPATENQTYVVLAPAVCLLAVQSFSIPRPTLARSFALAAFTLLLAAAVRNSLFPHLKSPAWMAIQPIAALLFLPAIFIQTIGRLRAPLR